MSKMKIDEKTYMEEGKLTLPLWMEGLIVTASDENIKAYEKALRFYSDKLEQTWE